MASPAMHIFTGHMPNLSIVDAQRKAEKAPTTTSFPHQIDDTADQADKHFKLWSTVQDPPQEAGCVNCGTCRYSTRLSIPGTPLSIQICIGHGENTPDGNGNYLIAQGPYTGQVNGAGLSLSVNDIGATKQRWFFPSVPGLATHPFPVAAYMNTDGKCTKHFSNEPLVTRVARWAKQTFERARWRMHHTSAHPV